jgi:hypothetical protein
LPGNRPLRGVGKLGQEGSEEQRRFGVKRGHHYPLREDAAQTFGLLAFFSIFLASNSQFPYTDLDFLD